MKMPSWFPRRLSCQLATAAFLCAIANALAPRRALLLFIDRIEAVNRKVTNELPKL
jgi:hypothetical protein